MQLLTSIILIALQLPAAVTGSTCGLPESYDAIDAEAFTLAAVRQPPVNFALPIGLNKTWVDLNLSATIDQAINTIAEAKADGVALIAFPELYFPGYPVVRNTFAITYAFNNVRDIQVTTNTLSRLSIPLIPPTRSSNMFLSLCRLIAPTSRD